MTDKEPRVPSLEDRARAWYERGDPEDLPWAELTPEDRGRWMAAVARYESGEEWEMPPRRRRARPN